MGWGYFSVSLNDFGKVTQENEAESSFMFWPREYQFGEDVTSWGTQELREVLFLRNYQLKEAQNQQKHNKEPALGQSPVLDSFAVGRSTVSCLL